MKRFAVLLVAVFIITNFVAAQKNHESARINSSAKKNLIAALKSDNEGLRSSAIYFAGYYKIVEAAEALSDILNSNSSNLNTRNLAANSLHRIGGEISIDALKYAVFHCSDRKLCLKCKLMYEDLINIKSGVAYQ